MEAHEWLAATSIIFTALLLPLIGYIWKTKENEVTELKNILAELRTKMETHELKSQGEIDHVKLDLSKTKTNYVERFGKLNEKLDIKFTTVNQSITDLALEVREALILVKQKADD